MKLKIIYGIFILYQLTFAQYNSFDNNTSTLQNSNRNIFGDKLQTVSSINPNFIYSSPIPGSIMNSRTTDIIIRVRDNIDQTSVEKYNLVEITGSISGEHNSKSVLSDDGKTIIIQPENIFAKGESVKVYLNNGLTFTDGSSVGSVEFSYTTTQKDDNPTNRVDPFRDERMSSGNISLTNFVDTKDSKREPLKLSKIFSTLPPDYPGYSITSTKTNPGLVFLSNFTWVPGVVSKPYLLIIDKGGNPFLYKKMPGECLDFKLQPNGLLTYYDFKLQKFFGMDTTFSIVDSFYCKYGYSTDVHELRILPNGHFLLIGDDYQIVDMSKIVNKGKTNAQVMGIIIQEFDKDKNVIFQWRSWDHFKITDATSDIDLTSDIIDYVHANAIEIDKDENIIISNRHLDELTKINRQTGDIIWRMGGKNNQFMFENDPVGFSHQHAIRRISNGNITLFDNGNGHSLIMPSRALEYQVDEENKITKLIWGYRNTKDEYSTAMGYVQRLENGNTFIGWGTAAPSIIEVSATGEKIFELSLPQNVFSYRAYSFQLSKPFYSAFIPKLKFPPSGIHVDGNTIDLTWNRNKLAQNFHVQVATDTTFSNPVYDNSNITDTTVSIQDLQIGYNYYWHVLSNNNGPNIGGYSGYSNTWKFSTSLTDVNNNNLLPQTYALLQNFPNPFNPTTTIEFELPKKTFVKLDIYDILGQKVKELVNDVKPAGYYQVNFDAKNLPSGIYIYNLEAGTYEKSMKMVVLK